MKKQFIFLIIFLFSCSLALPQVITNKYLFPMYPGDKIWEETRYPDRIKALEIPEIELAKLSNIKLIGACFEYPFYINLFAFDNLDEGFENLGNIFNGYPALLKRKNIEDDLIDFYEEMLAFKFKSKYSLYNESQNPLKFYLIEKILSQDQFIENLNLLQKRKLFFTCKEKSSGMSVFQLYPLFSKIPKIAIY